MFCILKTFAKLIKNNWTLRIGIN